MNYEPLNDNVLLEVLEKPPEMYKCKVVAVGPGYAWWGGRLKARLEVGDIVMVDRCPSSWIFDGEEKLLLRHEHKIRLKCK